MKRIYSDYAYGPGPRSGCWWDQTIGSPDWPDLQGEVRADVGIVGGGFTGISAALTLAEAGVSVVLLEAGAPGWGASGRNGGFCCLGGSRLSDADLLARFGAEGRQRYHDTERAAIELVAERLDRYRIDADRHSEGETKLAHSRRAMDAMRREAQVFFEIHGQDPRVIEPQDLAGEGLGSDFHGAVTIPVGFALNPRKYLFGIAAAARSGGARLYQGSAVTGIEPGSGSVVLTTSRGAVRCERAIIATNGYSSEDLPDWLAGRFMPTQSNILVTRPLSDAELDAQGWTSDQASYDSNNLLHYFRLMPDRRFLFGTRGGLRSNPVAEKRARALGRRHFERMFPAWQNVETPFAWSGMVCLSRTGAPYVGTVPGVSGLHIAMCYHGNGVAMASWSGTQLARGLLDDNAMDDIPPPMRTPLERFPLGRFRRALMPPAYAAMVLGDMF